MLPIDLNQLLNQVRERISPSPLAEPQEVRRLGLALSGGGGKGAAHLGVLQVLQELNIPIDLIAGTSAGGAVAVMYALGMPLNLIADTFRETALRRIAVNDPTRTGLIGGSRRLEIIKRLFGDRTFADLQLPCAVVCTDLASGQQVVIDSGPLVDAIMATTALPAIVPPLIRGEQILADGGIINNLPVDVATTMGAQRVIAVDLSDAYAPFELQLPPSNNPLARLLFAPQQLAVANRALSLVMARATALHLADHPPALLIHPDVAAIPSLDLENPERGWQLGEEATRSNSERLLELRAWRLLEDQPPPPPRPTWRWPEFRLPWLNLPEATEEEIV